MTKRSIALCRVLLFLALAITTHLATTEATYSITEDINDKAGHLLAFLGLALLMDLSFPERPFYWAKWAPLLLYGAAIEVIQYHIPYREFSLLDLTADGLGILIYWPFSSLVHTACKRKPPSAF